MTTQQDQIESKVLTLAQEAEQITITSQPHYEAAGSFLRTCRSLMDEIRETFDPVVDAAFKAHRQASAARKKHLDPLELARRIVERRMGDWATKVEQERKAEQQRLAAEQRKLLEDQAIRDAERLAKAGHVAEAEQILDTPIDVVPPEPETEKPKADGISYRDHWTASVIDLEKLVRHVVQHPELMRLVAPAESELNGFARSTKGQFQIPGVVFRCEKIMSTRKG